MGTKSVYETALLNTEVVLDSVASTDSIAGMTKRLEDGSALVNLPRYDKFNAAAMAIAEKGYRFREIAGNNSAILLTILTNNPDLPNLPDGEIVFTQPLASNPGHRRIAVAVKVANLHTLLLQLRKDKINIEHIFDF